MKRSAAQVLTDSNPDHNLSFERMLAERGFSAIAGADEVGRGPLAGPVVAACVILPENADCRLFLDSKALSHGARLKAYAHLRESGAAIGLGIVSPQTIDAINILQSSLLAMKRALEALAGQGKPADFVLVDGKFEIPIHLPQQTLIKGESRSRSIAAASIAAKVTRDEIMTMLHGRYPVYGFDRHKGYPTRAHRAAIAAHGPCPEHRTSFRGVQEFATQPL